MRKGLYEFATFFFEHPPTLQIIGQNDYFTPSITALPPHSITHWYSDHTPGPLLLFLSIDHPVTCLRSLIFHQNNISSSLIFSIPSKKRPLKKAVWSIRIEGLITNLGPSLFFFLSIDHPVTCRGPLISRLGCGSHQNNKSLRPHQNNNRRIKFGPAPPPSPFSRLVLLSNIRGKKYLTFLRFKVHRL